MTVYDDALEMAQQVAAAAAADSVPLTRLVYNVDQAHSSPVWLLPAPHVNPAHHRAKLGVWPWGEQGEEVLVQWCVEKGVEGAAAQHVREPRRLKPDWAWIQLLKDAQDGTFDKQLIEAEKRAGQPLTVWLDLGAASPADSGRRVEGKAQQEIWQTKKGRLKLQSSTVSERFGGYEDPASETYHQDRLGAAGSVQELMARLPTSAGQDWDWCWIDFGVGVVLPLGEETLSPAAIWERVLSPWRQRLL